MPLTCSPPRKTRIITDWQHKTSRRLVDRHDLIVMETLQAANMTRKPKPKTDPDKPGQWRPNGRNAKRALNKGMQQASLSRLRGMIEYKSKAAGITFLTVNPAYASQTCHHCGHVSKENRESQAVFHCHACGWRDNADVNAAKNILTDGLRILQAQAVAEARSGRDTSETRIQDTRPQAGQPSLWRSFRGAKPVERETPDKNGSLPIKRVWRKSEGTSLNAPDISSTRPWRKPIRGRLRTGRLPIRSRTGMIRTGNVHTCGVPSRFSGVPRISGIRSREACPHIRRSHGGSRRGIRRSFRRLDTMSG